jgi:hypothetical protein
MVKKQFSEEDKEWHQVLISLFVKILELRVHPIIIYDKKHFNRYLKNKISSKNVAVCIYDNGVLWLSPEHVNWPKNEIVNSIYHELLHIKHPRMGEKKIKQITDEFIPLK